MSLSSQNLVINYGNIAKNISVLNSINNKKIIAVIKNDAYNLGIENTTKELLKWGVNDFAVANISEAIRVRNINKNCRIIILNPVHNDNLNFINEQNFDLLICDKNRCFEQIEIIKKNKLNIKFHLVCNVGMNRFGLVENEILELIELSKNDIFISKSIIGLMTHFPVSDENDLTLHNDQVDYFVGQYNILKNIFNFEVIHSENSATFLINDERLDFCNYSRIGILLYGYKPVKYNREFFKTMFLTSDIIQINDIKKGENIGYGFNSFADDMKVGIIQLGYGDGIIADRKNYPVYINSKAYDIIAISMSHMYIKIDDDIMLNDSVEVYGNNASFDVMDGVTNSKFMCPLKRNV